MSAPASRLRLFFALWPDPAARDALAAAARHLHQGCGGRITRPDSIHLTLAFLGDADGAVLPALNTAAAGVSSPRFTMVFDTLGWWPRNGVAWAGCSSPPPPLAALAGMLAARIEPLGFAPDPRPFAPHVTLVRKARCRAPLPRIEPVSWPVSEFVLVRSTLQREGALYDIAGRWPLAGRGGD